MIRSLPLSLSRRNNVLTKLCYCRQDSTVLEWSSRNNNVGRITKKRWMSSSTEPILYTWGTNNSGSLLRKDLADTDKSKVDVPTAIENWKETLEVSGDNVSIAKIVCGATDTAVLLSDGRCYVCGENKNGQLGVGHKNPVTQPTLLELPLFAGETAAPSIQSVELGSTFSAIIDVNGDLYTFGYGGSTLGDGVGCLGHGTSESYLKPKLVESLVEDGCAAKQVQVGDAHMSVLTTDGEVLTCGAGSYGRLGNSETHQDQLYLEPVELLQTGIKHIAGGKSYTMALSDDGILYSWGRNHKGQLGTGFGLAVDMYAMQSVPEPIEADELIGREVIHISAGHSHAACITQGGEVFQWGMALYLEPVRVSELLHTKIVDVVCGENYSIALDEDGKIYSWGKGKTGVLGQGGQKQLNQASLVEALEERKVTSLSAGWSHVACLTEDSSF